MISCEPLSLADAAKCFDCVIPPGLQTAVQTYLLAVLAGGSTDPNTLIEAAKAFQRIPPQTLQEIQAYLLCQIASQ